MVKAKDFKRKITHNEYTFMNEGAKKVGIINKLDKEITHNEIKKTKESLIRAKGGFFKYFDDRYMELTLAKFVAPIMLGGFSLFFAVGITIILATGDNDPTEPITGFIIATVIFYLIFILFLVYAVTMPPKECLFNRQDSLITIPGFMWHKNITMPFSEIAFSFTQPSAQGIGAYQLNILRPDKMFSQYLMTTGRSCYEDLSFFVWYMDKNRPLPPGDAFDEFRERDFERRKAEGFPKPLFPARFETPEHTPEQQEERERIGGW